MNTNYQYKGVELSKILHPTTDTATYTNPTTNNLATIDLPKYSNYYSNMSSEDKDINPLVAAYPFGYDLPTPFNKSDNNSYREATYTDYSSTEKVNPPSEATHFSAILIGQGGQGGGGGGGFFKLQNGEQPYYSGQHGMNGKAGIVEKIENAKINLNKEMNITMGMNNAMNKGSTGYRNRNVVYNHPAVLGAVGANGHSTVLTYNSTSKTALGGDGGDGGGAASFYGSPYEYENTAESNPAELTFNNTGHTTIELGSTNYGAGMPGGNGGWGTSGWPGRSPVTKGEPENGIEGGPGLCRIYWKKKMS
jgi:hypothetical protein